MQVVRPMQFVVRTRVLGRAWSDLVRVGIANPRFAERMRVVERMRESGYDPLHTAMVDARAQRLKVLLPDMSTNGALWHEKAAAFGLEVRDPTADVRLLEFCLGIPDEQYARGGRDRWLIRRAMDGLLPPAVQWNVRRGSQAADLPLRLRADRANVDALVSQIAASPAAREYLDVDGIVQRWSAVQSTLEARSLIEAARLARALLFGLFLTRSKTIRA
jgi:asparagine synthase (glutamine-hydrolysing)